MFKKGDLVVSSMTYKTQFTAGKTYTVKYVPLNGHVGIEKDDSGSQNGAPAAWFVLKKEEFQVTNKPEVNFLILNESMVLNYEGKTVSLAKGDKRYDDVLVAIKQERLGDIPGIIEIERSFKGAGLELKDGLLTANGSPMPTELNDRILKFKDQGLPYKPLLKFWDNLKLNPSYNARQQLFKFLEHNGCPLTQDGHFISYRGVTDDFKDVHTKTFDNKPGAICEMDRSLVDDNPNHTCSTGLHVACYDYAKGFGPKLIEVKVNPKDVVAVPTDYNGTKMRVCRFEVILECTNIRTEQLVGPKGEAVTEKNHSELFDDNYDDQEDLGRPNYRHTKRGPKGQFIKS